MPYFVFIFGMKLEACRMMKQYLFQYTVQHAAAENEKMWYFDLRLRRLVMISA